MRNSNALVAKLDQYLSGISGLEGRYQHFVAEVIMLRLFAELEESIAEIAYKLGSGASYSNGALPSLTVRSRSLLGARNQFLTFGRGSKPLQFLRWTKANFIHESVKNVIPLSEKFNLNVSNHSLVINEMRKVRNAIGHQSASAKADFRQTVRSIYGANVNLTPGAFLVSEARSSPCRLKIYIQTAPIILSDLCSGI